MDGKNESIVEMKLLRAVSCSLRSNWNGLILIRVEKQDVIIDCNFPL